MVSHDKLALVFESLKFYCIRRLTLQDRKYIECGMSLPYRIIPSRLSLSRIPRDSLKNFEISVSDLQN